MQATPIFLGACAFASLAGAFGGASINTDPIQRASIGSDQIHRPAIAFDASDAETERLALPEHYALTTPEGRVEVAELSSRGLYAQQRYGWRDAAFEASAEPAFVDTPPEPPVLAEPEAFPSEPMVEDTAEPAPVTLASGGPRIIDVAAALAERH